MSLIFLLEDDTILGKALKQILEAQEFRVNWAQDLRTARRLISAQPADLLILDWMLPDGEGVDIYRALPAPQPTIFLVAEEAEEKVVGGLGAHFLRKPFQPADLWAQIKKILGEEHDPRRILRYADLKLDLGTKSATYANVKMNLKGREFSILQLLITNFEEVVPHDTVMEVIDNEGEGMLDRTVDSHVARLRKALRNAGASSIEIESVDTGYRLKKQA